MKHSPFVGLATLVSLILLGSDASAHLTEQTKLLASDGLPGDQFGSGVDIDGMTAVVGAPLHLVSGVRGAVYVYQRSTDKSWPEMAKLTPTGAGVQDMFGSGVALAGPYLAVNAPKASSDAGAVYIFNGFGSTWTQTQVLTASDAAAGHGFGRALAIEGSTLVVGAAGNEAAYVFRLVAGSWVEEQKLMRPTGMPDDEFGFSVALLGDEILVGAPAEDTDGTDAGSAFLFNWSGTSWDEGLRFASLTPGDGDRFGESVCLGQIYAGVGAPYDDDAGVDSGAAHRFTRDISGWISDGTMTAPAAPTFAGDHLGKAIAVDTKLFLVSQPDGDLQGAQSGGAQTFIERVGIFYGDVLFPSDTGPGDNLGASIGMSGCWLASGAPLDDDKGENSGSAYLSLANYNAQFYCLPGISAAGCAATLSVSGTPSASATSGFTVFADGVDGGISGLYFFGTAGAQQVSWGNGTSFQCVVPPVVRMGTFLSTVTPDPCAGRFVQDFNATWCSTCPLPLKNPGAGAEIYFQLWYRDPNNTSNQSTSLSNAGQMAVCP